MAGLSAARKAAYTTLTLAHERDAYVRELVNGANSPLAKLNDGDRAFAAKLALGVTATRGSLDELLDRFLAKPGKVDPEVRDALRLATYEMLYLEKSPHVAVSQGVELVKTRAKSASGLANAVLRKVADAAPAFLAESPAHACGLPAWLLERVEADLGPSAAAAYAASCAAPAPVYLATVPMWITDKRAHAALLEGGVNARSAGAVPGAWRAVDPAAAAKSPLLEECQAVVCDYGAQVVSYLAAPQPGDRMLEVGSGRGTKTILLAGHAHREQGAARIWSLDVHKFKAKLAAERLEKARVAGVKQVTADARSVDAVADLPMAFERILVDAPCSGSGTLRRHPEITWSLTPADVAACAQLQLELLSAVAPRLAEGGLLVYATCSVLREENEDVVNAFLASPAGAGFELVHPADVVPASNGLAVDELAERSTPEGFMRTAPAPDSCDGHFAACLRHKRA